ncbi:MAG: nucleoside triphosphate pyrophosphohydrolase [Proteobacteria bacterium]|nr:nucleoside triphosphate pyrophosphohydrolase [Pseudomonadota bacterium]
MRDEHKFHSERMSGAFCELVEIVHRLRAPDGCPWDREQTPKSLKSYIIEEAYEAIDAIDDERPEEICEELGDLLLQVVLQAEIASEQGVFTIENVVRGISKKLIDRHPHVFGEVAVKNTGEVLVNWEQIKKKEKAGRGLFQGLPRQLPALQKAERTGEKAARVGFDWPDSKGVREKVTEELAELDEAVSSGSKNEIRHELGDLLFAVAQWARHLGEQPEEALRSCCSRFVDRFSKMERALSDEGTAFKDTSIEELERFWQRAKEAQQSPFKRP